MTKYDLTQMSPEQIVLALHPRDEHSREHTAGLAELAHQALFQLGIALNASNAATAVPYPADAYRLIGRLVELADVLRMLAERTGYRQVEFGKMDGLALDSMGPDEDPKLANYHVFAFLESAAELLSGASDSLNRAYRHARRLKIDEPREV